MYLKSKIISVINLGINSQQTFIERRRIKTLNILNVFVIVSLIIGASNGSVLKSNYPILTELLFLILATFSLLLNKYQKQLWSFLVFTININLSVLFISEYYPKDTGTYLFYFPLIVSIFLLNNPAKFDRYTATHLGISLISFLLSIFIDIPALQNHNFTPENIKLLWTYDIIFSVSTTAFLSLLLSKLIHDQNKEMLLNYYEQQKSQKELTNVLNQKEILLAELHHRVKNNLAIMSGLLNLQENATPNAEAKLVLGESKNRIMSMALVHKMLYKNSDFKTIKLQKYTNSLLIEILNTYNLCNTVKVTGKYDDIELTTTELIPYGLILNEIFTNSIKYAFTNHKTPEIYITAKKNIQTVKLVVHDNGPGFPKDYNIEANDASIGISLIKTLSNQLDGEAQFFNDNGAKIQINFQYG